MAIFSAIGAAVGAIAGAVGGAVAAVGTFIGGLGAVGSFVLRTAVGIGLSLLSRAIAGKPEQPRFSVQGQLQAGGDIPRSIIFGRGATAGSLTYANTWGSAGKTPNAYITQVIALSDLPVHGLEQVWVNGEPVTLGNTATSMGYPVLEYRKGGKDHLWIKFYDGTQTAADSFLTSTVSSAQRPYPASRVGYGVAYAVCTAKIHEELFTGFPQFRFVLDGLKLYDPSRDSTVGGIGSHRWDDPSTWGGDGDHLPAVQLYNLLRGIYYNGQWVYGLQGVTAPRLPVTHWIAQINKCRAEIDGPNGKEPIYRTGGEIPVNAQIASAAEAILTGCQGRLAEIGGTYKLHVGAPDAPSAAITDGEILSTEEQTFTPFFGLADTINGIAATYPSPEEGWVSKAAPPLYRTDLEALAGNRRLMADVALDLVPYKGQVQRLMKSALLEAQRARRHTITLPPKYWTIEPGDYITWTSERNGYVDKLFRVDGVIDKANLDVIVDITEVDPSDYDWDQEVDYREPVFAPVGPIRPAPQSVSGWHVQPYIIRDADNNPRRSSIEVIFDGDEDDVQFVRVLVRLKSSGAIVFDTTVPYGDPETNPNPHSIVLNGTFIPGETYEVRGRFVPYSDRPTEWTAWLEITTENILIDEIDLSQPLRDLLSWMEEGVNQNAEDIILESQARAAEIAAERQERIVDGTQIAARLRDLVETVGNQSLQLGNILFGQVNETIQLRQELAIGVDGAKAYSDQQITLAVGPGSALAGRLSSLEASIDGVESDLSAAVTTLEEAIADGDADEASARQALALQVRGSYTGNDFSQVTEGLLYQINQARISDTEALADSISLVSAGVGILFDWQIGWAFDTSAEGWTGNGTPTATGGWLRPANHATEPYVVSPDALAVNGAAYKEIKLRLRKTGNPAWRGYIWWKGEGDTTWDAARRVEADEPAYDGDIAILTVDLPWTGSIKQIRIDLSSEQSNTDYFEIDWIYVGRPSPGASQAQIGAVQTALSSAIMAEASARETLSTILTGEADPDGLTLPALTSGLLYSEREARSTADAALGLRIDAVETAIDDPSSGLSALAVAQSLMQSDIIDLDGRVTINAQNISDTVAQLDDKADVSVTDSLQAQIEALGSEAGFVSLAQSVRALEASAHHLALNQSNLFLGQQQQQIDLSSATARVRQELYARVEVTEDSIESLAGSVTALQSQVGDISSTFTMRAETLASPESGWSRFGIQVKSGTSAEWSEAGFFMDVDSGGGSRVVVLGDHFVIADPEDPTNMTNAFVFAGGTATLQNIRLGTLKFDVLESNNGKLKLTGFGDNASIEVFN